MTNASSRVSWRAPVLLFTLGIFFAAGFGDLVLREAGDPLPQLTEERLKRTLAVATVAYLSTAAINATVSVFKTSQMEAGFIVFGGRITVGEILDPVDDLVEQLSSVLTLCIVSLGVQRLLISVGVDICLPYVLGPGLFMIAAGMLIRRPWAVGLRRVGRLVVIIGLLGRFGLPLVFLVSEEVSERTLAAKMSTASGELDSAHKELRAILLHSSDSMQARLDQAQAVSEDALAAIIDLMVAFIFRVVLLPLLLLYLLGQVSTQLLHRAPAIMGLSGGRA